MTATIDRDERESSSREDTLTDVRISGDQDLAAADATLAALDFDGAGVESIDVTSEVTQPRTVGVVVDSGAPPQQFSVDPTVVAAADAAGTATPSPTPAARVSRSHRADSPRAIRARNQDDMMSLWGSFAGSFALVWVLYTQVLPFTGRVGFVICWFFVFLAMYAGVTAVGNPPQVIVDRLVAATVRVGALMVFGALATAVLFTFQQGMPALLNINFFTQDMAGVRPTDPLDQGGILHAVLGSVIEIGIAVAITLPLGIGCAIYMNEIRGKLSRIVRTVVEAMTALPSIVAGLFIYTVLIVALGISRTGIAAAAAIAVMMLPIIARSADVVLRVMPGGLREASLALGASKWQTVRQVVIPTVRSGLATALILGIARGVGETSPVLLTSGASTFLNADPLNEPMNSLPLFVFSAVRSGEPLFIQRGFGAASVLLILVLILFMVTRFLARQKVGGR